MKKILLPFFIFLSSFGLLQAQMDRYWDANLNSENALMGGAAVAGVGDVGASFYNPASISRSFSSKLAFNTSVISVRINKIQNGVRQGENLRDENIQVVPRAFSFMYKPKKLRKVHFELLTMVKNQSILFVNEGFEFRADTFNPETEGEDVLSGNVYIRNSFNDAYMGGGVAINLNDRWSIGTSSFLTVKRVDQQNRLSYTLRPTADSFCYQGDCGPSYVTSSDYNKTMRMYEYGMLFKGGINYLGDEFSFGVTFTTPSFKILGSGFSERLIDHSNYRNDSTGELVSYRAQDWQGGLPARYKDPFSIALGLRFQNEAQTFQINVTAEYFTSIKAYRLLTSEPNPNITDPEIYDELPVEAPLTYVQAADDVFNVAIGFRVAVGKKDFIYGGFRTDFNARSGWDLGELEDYQTLNSVDFDLYHFTGGSTFRIKGVDLILGAQYSYGAGKNKTPFFGVQESLFDGLFNQPNPESTNMKLIQHKITLFVGATINFLKQLDQEETQPTDF